jgi:hypothetical protein
LDLVYDLLIVNLFPSLNIEEILSTWRSTAINISTSSIL